MQYSNEELAQKIQAGQVGFMPLLWEQVQAFVRQQAARWFRAWQSSRPSLEFDDLYQCGYIAMSEAVKTYQADKGMTFIGWLSNYLRTEFAREIGCRTEKQRQDPLSHAVSLDAPTGGETEDVTLRDTIADPKDPYEGTEADIYHQQLKAVVGEALGTLPQKEQEVLKLRYYDEQTQKEISKKLDCHISWVGQLEHKAFRKQRKSQAIQEVWPNSYNLYRGVGLSVWRQSGYSVQERVLIHREEKEALRGGSSAG